jgi:ER-bound oxygenase mpaB/B'/Rubber oxygenase, catalytic domain
VDPLALCLPVIPTEFRYWDHLERPRVRRLRAFVRRILGFDPAPPDDVVRTLGEMYYDADPLCEAFVDDVYMQQGSRAGRALLERALAVGVDAMPDAPASLRALFADLDHDPPWVDHALVARGAKAFRRYGVAMFRFAGAITLEGYAESSVAKPLALTGVYAGGSTRRRFLETVAFWIAVSEPGALARGGAGRGSALRVRVMHVFVRKKLLAHPDWNLAAWGVPISQGDALLTLMGGSFAPGLGLALLGYWPSRDDILAMNHFWRYVGHVMGVRPRWFPQTFREAAQLAFVTAVKGARLAGDDGKQLCRSYANAFADQGLEHRIHLAYTQLFMSRRSHRATALPTAGPWLALPLAVAPLTFAVELARRAVPGVDRLVDRFARRRRQRWFARHMGERVAEYAPVESFTR